ncbi:hypothetical protein Y5W_03447 [Alcanivorax sp. 521-1]|uniref:EamA domain-containing protein n=1 Tax=Alloalcanivorax profundimaris TaxID=2735259 RepID=A0ABS0AVJ1_9GAMM|nr:DMT family transporter [Alloalcanivorax profundimaris]MBF5058153.1 hypothetical protein [Alloalcanivorax profundimaris]MBM1144329.1 DMT family transporter [Alcanivorax sp. ZXX171]MBU57386.1 EamA family transporter [Alcanivorax sp.]
MPPRSEPQWDLYGLHLAAFMLAGTALFAKLVPLPALDITGLRGGIAALALLVVMVLGRARLRLPSARHYLAMLIGGLLFAVHWMTYFHAMQVSSVAVGVVALLTFPVITAVIEPPLLHRHAPRGYALLAGLAVLAGVTLIGLEGGLAGNVPLGLAVGIFSAVLYSLRNLLQKRFLDGVSGPQVMLYQGALTALVFAPFLSTSPLQLAPATWGLLLLLGTVFTAVPHTLITHGLRRLSATTVSFTLALQVPYATLLAALVLSETPGPLALAGGALVVAASLFVTARQRRQPAAVATSD